MTAGTWTLALTAPRAELRACRGLTLRGIHYELFLKHKRMVRHGRIIMQRIPAFSGYLFLLITDDRQWPKMREVDGVLGWMRGPEGTPVHVSESVLEHWRNRVNSDGVLDLPEESGFQFGARVRVAREHSWVFGQSGIYQHATTVGKAWILMPWFNNQMVGTELDVADLEHDEEQKRTRGRRGGRARNNRYRSAADRAMSCAV